MGLHQEDGSVRLMHVRLEPALVQRAHGVLQGVCLFVSVSVPVAVSVSVSVSVFVTKVKRRSLRLCSAHYFTGTKELALIVQKDLLCFVMKVK
jgi:hypothetical protein